MFMQIVANYMKTQCCDQTAMKAYLIQTNAEVLLAIRLS